MNITPIRHQNIDQSGNRVIPNVSIEASLIVGAFKDRAPGFMLRYEEIDTLIGREIRQSRGYLTTARRILAREHGMLIETVLNEGVRVATEDGKVNASRQAIKGMDRQRRKGMRILDITDAQKLSESVRREYNAQTALLGSLRLLTTPTAVKKIAEASPDAILPSASVLGLFSK